MRARLLGSAAVLALSVSAVLVLAAPVSAVSVPFSEDFAADASGWLNATSGPLTWNATGGPDGGSYVSSTFGSLSGNGTIQFRANDSANASGDAFVGNWIASGVSVISAEVFHDAPEAITFFFRFAGAGAMVGFPASGPVAPNTWTTIQVLISPGTLIPAGGSFATTMAAISNLQMGVSVPLELENVSFTYGVDKVTIVPEPATAGLLAGGLTLLAVARRRRTAQR